MFDNFYFTQMEQDIPQTTRNQQIIISDEGLDNKKQLPQMVDQASIADIFKE